MPWDQGLRYPSRPAEKKAVAACVAIFPAVPASEHGH